MHYRMLEQLYIVSRGRAIVNKSQFASSQLRRLVEVRKEFKKSDDSGKHTHALNLEIIKGA